MCGPPTAARDRHVTARTGAAPAAPVARHRGGACRARRRRRMRRLERHDHLPRERSTASAEGPTPARTVTAGGRTATFVPTPPSGTPPTPAATPTAAATPTSAGTGGNPTSTPTPSGSVSAGAQSVASAVVPFLILGAPLATGV